MLIDAGADIEAEGDPGSAHPLHLAAYTNQPEAAKLLLDRGAKVDARDALERTALGVAAAYGYVEVVAMLLEHRADPNVAALESCGRPLQYATKSNSLAIADLLLAHGAGINETSAGGVTALHCAMNLYCTEQSPTVAMIEFLMARGADASIVDWNGNTAIDYAKIHGSPRLISVVLSQSASK
jgi:ankyrin repeat protein